MGILIIIGLHVRVRSEILPPLLGRLQSKCENVRIASWFRKGMLSNAPL